MLRAWGSRSWCAATGRGICLLTLAAFVSAQEPAPKAPDEPSPPTDRGVAAAQPPAPAEDVVQLDIPSPVAIDTAPVEPALYELPATEAEGDSSETEDTAETDDTDLETPSVDVPDGGTALPGESPDIQRSTFAALPSPPTSAEEPHDMGSLSMGTPDGGLLFNPEPFPEGTLWTIREPADSFATRETIAFITTAIQAVEARYPGSPRLVIGDISRPDGGRLDRHRSHQAGRDADLGFYFTTGDAHTLKKPGQRDLDLPRLWAFVRALVTETDVERIFLDRQIQRRLYHHAISEGEDRTWLDDIFGRRTAGKDAIIQHERRHQDHLHVRFYNREAQERGRLAYPALVEAGLLPGPTLKHRVRTGETLSHLVRRYGVSAAKIRAANGLRGSTLRAGRTYAIPVRRMPDLGTPVVVPARRLPPTPSETPGAAAVVPAEDAPHPDSPR